MTTTETVSETIITATELSRHLSDILNRVKYRGERFAIQRNGETIATLAPASKKLGITAKELVARIGNLQMPGDGFANDLEAIQAEQGIAELTEWPD
jgi:antitoxin (DNA-binding transcriptional repressor) of toxin-antitoxin stability system